MIYHVRIRDALLDRENSPERTHETRFTSRRSRIGRFDQRRVSIRKTWTGNISVSVWLSLSLSSFLYFFHSFFIFEVNFHSGLCLTLPDGTQHQSLESGSTGWRSSLRTETTRSDVTRRDGTQRDATRRHRPKRLLLPYARWRRSANNSRAVFPDEPAHKLTNNLGGGQTYAVEIGWQQVCPPAT